MATAKKKKQKKNGTLVVSSLRSDWRVLRHRWQPTPTEPIFVVYTSVFLLRFGGGVIQVSERREKGRMEAYGDGGRMQVIGGRRGGPDGGNSHGG